MSDLIDRQAAIDAMGTWNKFGCDPNGILVWYDDNKHYVPYVRYDDMVYAIKSLPSAQPEQVCVATVTLTDEQVKEVAEKAKNAVISVIESEPHWIPCSERLPNHDEYIKNNGLFIVSDGNRSYSEWYDIYNKRKFGEPTMSGFRIDYAVTAWMPLPEPYNGGEM